MKPIGSAVRMFGLAGVLASTAWAGEVNQLVCDLRGDQGVPINTSPGHGCGRFIIDTNANTLEYHIVFDGMLGVETAAHIHGVADPGQTAGIQHALPLGSPKTGTWNYDESVEDDILAGKMYVNIHSTVFGGGELRGQIAKMVATIDAVQTVPLIPCATAVGWGVFSIDVCNNTLEYHIRMTGALCGVETAAHIHGSATHGSTAGAQHTLPAGNPKIGSWTYPESMESDILQGMMYVNIHSNMFPAGVARGQITQIVVPIDGSQEVPANASPSVGCAHMSLDKDNDALGYYVRWSPTMAATAGHIHGFANPNQNAGVLHTLLPGPPLNPNLGTWNYGAAQEAGILDSMTYFNLHTVALPGGEIRGQIYIPAKKSCGVPCPWDCGDSNGEVDTVDFLALLAQWGQTGTSCDFDDNGVDTVDFLKLLSVWGPCP